MSNRIKIRKRYVRPDGKSFEVDFDINLDEIMLKAASKARWSKTGKTRLLDGHVKATIVKE